MVESYVSDDEYSSESSEYITDDEEEVQHLKQIGTYRYYADPEPEPEYLKCTDPVVLAYNKEIDAYEGFYVTNSEHLRKTYVGGVHPSNPDLADITVDAAKLVVEHYNKEASEPLEFEELMRSNVLAGCENLWYLTFCASNGKFYEAKAWVSRGRVSEFCFLREAKYYPNLDSSSSSSSSPPKID